MCYSGGKDDGKEDGQVIRRVDDKRNTRNKTDRLRECDMPRRRSVSLCLLCLEFGLSAKDSGKKGGSEGLSDFLKMAYLNIQQQAPVFLSNKTEHLPSLVVTVYPRLCIDFYLRTCDKQCSRSKHPLTLSLLPLVVKGYR